MRGPDGVLAGSVLTMIEAVRNLHALGVPLDGRGRRRDRRRRRACSATRSSAGSTSACPPTSSSSTTALEIERVLVAGDVHVAVCSD